MTCPAARPDDCEQPSKRTHPQPGTLPPKSCRVSWRRLPRTSVGIAVPPRYWAAICASDKLLGKLHIRGSGFLEVGCWNASERSPGHELGASIRSAPSVVHGGTVLAARHPVVSCREPRNFLTRAPGISVCRSKGLSKGLNR